MSQILFLLNHLYVFAKFNTRSNGTTGNPKQADFLSPAPRKINPEVRYNNFESEALHRICLSRNSCL